MEKEVWNILMVKDFSAILFPDGRVGKEVTVNARLWYSFASLAITLVALTFR